MVRPLIRTPAMVLSTAALASCASGHDAQDAANTYAGATETSTPQTAGQIAALFPYATTFEQHPAPPRDPNYGPKYGSITFTDVDPGETIGGTITMGRAVNAEGERINEADEGIGMYMIHWGLEVGEPGVDDDKGKGDHGGDCRGFRDTTHIVMEMVSDLGDDDTMSWEIPVGTEIPADAEYFVGHTIYVDSPNVYEQIHNLQKCTQIPIVNMVVE